LGGSAPAVLVTGGAGYIGSHAAKALHGAGYRVIVYDNLVAGHRGAVRYGELVEGEIADVASLRAVMREHDVVGVMHFAAFLDVGESVRDPIRYYRNNVIGALGVLEAMAAENVHHFVFSSTCATYGEPIETPITETHPQNPINSYGETKLAIEHALPHLQAAHGIRWVALRYFNASGADPDGEMGEDHSPEIHLIPRAIEAAAGGRGLQVFGDDYPTPDGTCLRDYVHVTDLAAAHLLALGALDAGATSTSYNLGNGRPTSVRQVLDAVERVTGRAVPYTKGARRPGDPAVLFASSDRIKRELGWQPRYEDIDTIVATAWRWRDPHPGGYRGREGA
jgi:UDP-glucose-4-epimerase GalE